MLVYSYHCFTALINLPSIELECQTSLVNQSANEEITNSADPPRLTQTPPVMNTVSVPRPVPLVQSNLSFALVTGLPVSQTAASCVASKQAVKATDAASTIHSVQDMPDVVKFGEKNQQLQEVLITFFISPFLDCIVTYCHNILSIIS